MLNTLVMLIIVVAGRPWWHPREQEQSYRRSLDVTEVLGTKANQVGDRHGHYVQDEFWHKSVSVMKRRTWPARSFCRLALPAQITEL